AGCDRADRLLGDPAIWGIRRGVVLRLMVFRFDVAGHRCDAVAAETPPASPSFNEFHDGHIVDQGRRIVECSSVYFCQLRLFPGKLCQSPENGDPVIRETTLIKGV